MSKLPGTTDAKTRARLRTAIVTGASRGIGAGVTRAFLDLDYNVVANALHFVDSALVPNGKIALVEGNIGQASTAIRVAETAISRFGSIDTVVANAGIFFTKPFTDYTPDDFRRLSETNLEGYLYITQLAVKQMLAQKTGGRLRRVSGLPRIENEGRRDAGHVEARLPADRKQRHRNAPDPGAAAGRHFRAGGQPASRQRQAHADQCSGRPI